MVLQICRDLRLCANQPTQYLVRLFFLFSDFLFSDFVPLPSFLEGLKAALISSKDFDDGHYKVTPQHGIRAFARVYSAWAYGQTVSISN